MILAFFLSFQGGLAADFELPEGLEVTLWAETPQLYNPTAIDVDAKGRVWVTEAVNYRRWDGRNPGYTRAGGDRVVILEDSDRDERCDSSRVFVQDPELVAPLGILVRDESSAYVSCSPSIFLYTDRNGDGDAMDAGEKEVFLTGFGGHDHDHGVHSLVDGHNRRLYFTVGNAGPHVVTDKSGWTLRSGSVYCEGGAAPADNKPCLVSDDGRVYTGGLILSVKTDGTDLRVEAHNFRNPYEVATDGFENLYTFDNDDEVLACRVSWILPGGNYGFFSADGSRTWRADQRPGQSIPIAQWHQEDPGVVQSGVITGAGGPTGVYVYSESMLRNWYGALLAADAGRGSVFAFRPVADGAGVRLDPLPALIAARSGREAESARWFRPSDVCAGFDGALFVADWYDPGVGGHAMGDERCYGRILRVVRKENAAADSVAEPELADLQKLVEPFFLRAMLRASKGNDLLVLGNSQQPSSAMRREVLFALRDVPLERCQRPLLELARRFDGQDRFYLEAFGLACAEKEDAVYPLLEEELGDVPSQWDARFAGLAWRLHPPRALPAFVARAMDPALSMDARKQAIDAIAFMKTREAAEAMASLAVASPEDLRPYARWWLENRATNDWRGFVHAKALGGRLEDAQLVWKSGVVRSGLREIDLDLRGATRLWLVVGEGEHGNSYDWADWLAPRFEGAGGIRRLVDLPWLSAQAGWGTTNKNKNCEGGPLVVEGKTHHEGIGTHARSEIAFAVPAGAERFRATAAPDDMGSRRAGSTNELEFQVWIERAPSRERIERLTSAALGPQLEPRDRSAALRELALDPEGGLVLIRAAERGALDDAQRAAIAEHIFENPDLGVRALASEHFRRPGEERALPPISELVQLQGSAPRGRELFFEPRAQCGACHALERGGRRKGGDIGPELTGVRQKFDAGAIFDALLNPSAAIATGYETWRVETNDGRLFSGFLLADGATLVLKDTQGKRHALPAEEIADRSRERLSTMPSGLAAGLAPQELADLVAFLREDPEREPSFGPPIELWNGRDFSGWTFHLSDPEARPEDVWSVVDGTIVCKGNPAGYFRTEAAFTNFELELEWRFDPSKGPGNSGVLLRTQAPDKVWPRSIEAQLLSRQAGDIWNIDEFPMQVDVERTSGRHTERARPCSEKELGQWNHYRIRLDRERLTLEVNGVLQNTASFCQEIPGKISLQSEGAWIQFRNIRLRPILERGGD